MRSRFRKRKWCSQVFGVLVFFLLLSGCGNSNSFGGRTLLPENYIWFGPASLDKASTRFFRKSFTVSALPDQATLYVAGPYNWDIFLNGMNISQLRQGGPTLVHDRPVIVLNLASDLRIGLNVLAIQASASDVLAAKIVPAAQGVNASVLVLSDTTWRAAAVAPSGWEQPGFDDSTWGNAKSLGSIELDPSRFQGNFDLGMYQWPGYQGLSALLDHATLEPVSVTPDGGGSVLIDFGREISGRLVVVSTSQQPISLALTFGESAQEATPSGSFLGTRNLVVPGLSTAFGPLTAFRFVLVTFNDGTRSQSQAKFHGDQVLRNLPLQGSFSSSDDLLNRIWQTSVYTTQLGMQETLWDAPKRDRDPYAGDLFVAGRTTQIAFGNQQIIPDTLTNLLNRVCSVGATENICPDINGIPSYNAWWVIDLADWYRFSGDLSYLRTNEGNLIQILNLMASETTGNLFDTTKTGTDTTVFSDWSPGMIQFGSVSAPETVKITTFVYYMALEQAAFLLQQLGESAAATEWQQTAVATRDAAINAYWEGSSFGARMQTNAMAIFSGVADDSMTASIYEHVLSQPATEPVTPYFNYFVISAMAHAGHSDQALALIRQQWGSMLQAGATSFWEVYDPACPSSPDFHTCLTSFFNSVDNQGTNQLFVSLAHAWSSGPAPWLKQNVLGVDALVPGYKTVEVRPDLAGLQWAQGTVPTPAGNISISIEAGANRVRLEIPYGLDAYVSLPSSTQNPVILVNGAPVSGSLIENGSRARIHLTGGHYMLQSL